MIEREGLDGPAIFDPAELSGKTSLPVLVVERLLHGERVPDDSVEERVCARMRTISAAHMASRGMGKMALVNEVAERLSLSTAWARKLVDGEKVPTVTFLHQLVRYFGVEDERYFTATASDALNRVLLPVLERYENPESDPVQALMKRYGIVGADMRQHGMISPEQLEALFAGVIKSVMPPRGDDRP
ncbi:hypothetical protein [Streptomyces sp. NPDC046985]|uniref:hypothetical protein n=1 Tax=Streptomyces sp. NPDC046985 TaxID=3155377 RepID=UPI0033E8D92E